MPESNLEIVRRTVQAVNAGDLQRAFENFDTRIAFDQSRPTGLYEGLDGVREAIRRWSEVWTEKRVEAEEFIDAGEEIVVITHEYARSARTEMELDRRVVEVWTLCEAKVVAIRSYRDKAEALAAVADRPAHP